MATKRLSGLRRLDDVSTRWDVSDYPGVYLFYETQNGPLRYVGRSDTSLLNRIRGRGYRYYKYKHCSRSEAFYWECRYWHYWNPLDNKNHPAEPSGTTRIHCAFC